MKTVEPKVYLTGNTELNIDGINEWLESIGVKDTKYRKLADGEYAIDKFDGDGLISSSHIRTSSEAMIELAGRRCYMSFQLGLNPNITKTRSEIADYISNILDQGHGSVLEHVTFNFAIENVSRVFTGEMNRHRAGVAISEGSMRYIRYTNIPFWIPNLIKLSESEEKLLNEYIEYNGKGIAHEWQKELTEPLKEILKIAIKKWKTIEIFHEVFSFVEHKYVKLCEIWADEISEKSTFKWKKYLTSMFRRIIPMGVATGGKWSFNIRALRHICEMRCSPAAEEEILFVANKILAIMINKEPNLFGDFVENKDGYWTPKYHKV